MTSKKKWAISVFASIVLVVGVFLAVFGTGSRFFVVETPSMATAAPVGTLVVVRPHASYAIGDIISYHAANSTRIYTHRIVDKTAQGWILKGDLNGASDPLPVTDSQIVGGVDLSFEYVGFFVRGLPWILLGCAIIFALTMHPRIPKTWRWQIRLVGWSLVISIVTLWLRPWVNLVMTGYVPADVGVDMHLVNTGIFPVDVIGTVLQSGQDAVVNQTVADPDGKYRVTPSLALTFGWFMLLFAICITPFIASIFIRVEEDSPSEPPVATPPKRVRTSIPGVLRPREIGIVSIAAAAMVAVLALFLHVGTQAAYAATIRNSTNSAGTRTWFTCQNAEVGTANARFVWGLTATGTQTDLSGHSRTGTMTTNGTAATASTSSPCVRDTQGSVMFNGGTCFYQGTAVTVAQVYSMEVWFRTNNTSLNGKLMGLADNTTPNSQAHYDRHIYIDPTGRVVFGAYVAGQMVVASSSGKNYADNVWHHVVATSNATSISLYIDGALISTRSDTANQDSYSGYWMVGCGQLADWQDATGVPRNFSDYYTGNMRLAAVYDATLTAAQVQEHYLAGVA